MTGHDPLLDALVAEGVAAIPEDMRPTEPPAPALTIEDLRRMTVIDVPTAGRALGVGKDAAYALAREGVIPTLALGRRLVVPCPKLLALLGAEA